MVRRVLDMQRLLSGALLYFTVACGPSRATSVAVPAFRDSSGTSIAENPLSEDRPLRWSSEESHPLLDSLGDPYLFSRSTRQWVAVDDRGRVLVLDLDRSQVVAFDVAGRLLGAIGSPGRGPGQLGMPSVLHAAKDTVLVYDESKRAVVRWSEGGSRILSELRVMDSGHSAAPVAAHGDRLLLVSSVARSDGTEWRLEWWPKGAPVTSVRDTVSRRPFNSACDWVARPRSLPAVFAPSTEMAGRRGRLAVTTASTALEFRIIDESGVDRIVRRAVPLVPAGRRALPTGRAPFYRVSNNGKRCEITYEDVAEQTGIAANFPSASEVALLEDGTVWIRRTPRDAARSRVDAFSVDGAYLGTLTSDFLPAAAIGGDRYVVPDREQDSGGLTLSVRQLITAQP